MLCKNDVLKVKIESVTGDGQGIARVNSEVVFVPFAALGDFVRIVIIKRAKTYAVGKILEILTPSMSRVESDCKAFGKCGGCSFRHVTLEEELRIKTEGVRDVMKRLGGIDVQVENTLLTPHKAYRNKVQLPVTEDEKGLRCGFYASYSHRVVDNTLDCLATPEIFSEIAKKVLEFMKREKISGYNEEAHLGLVRHFYMRQNAAGKVMLCLVLNGTLFKNKDCENRFCTYITELFENVVSIYVNKNTQRTNAVLTEDFRLLWGQDYLEDTLLDTTLRMSPDSFFQINRDGAETVYKTAFSLLPEKHYENVYDLYCGVGSIGLTLFSQIRNGYLKAISGRLFGVEIVEKAAVWARENAKLNGIENADFKAADSADITGMEWFDKFPPSLVILDPPRKGTTEKLLSFLADKNVPDILYISCNPATLARDMSYLYSRGYKAEKVVPVNLFPRTSHTECATLLSKGK